MIYPKGYFLARNAALLGAPLPVWIGLVFGDGLERSARTGTTLGVDWRGYPLVSYFLFLAPRGGERIVAFGGGGLTPPSMATVRELLIQGRTCSPKAVSFLHVANLGSPGPTEP